MKPSRNECLSAVISELETHSIRYHVHMAGKHIKVRYGPDLEFLQVVSLTPSDGRSKLNARSDIRRALRSQKLTA